MSPFFLPKPEPMRQAKTYIIIILFFFFNKISYAQIDSTIKTNYYQASIAIGTYDFYRYNIFNQKSVNTIIDSRKTYPALYINYLKFRPNKRHAFGLEFAYLYSVINAHHNVLDYTKNIQGDVLTFDDKISRHSFSLLFKWQYILLQGKRLHLYFNAGLGTRFAIKTLKTNEPNEDIISIIKDAYNINYKQLIQNIISAETTFGIAFKATPQVQLFSEIGMAKTLFKIGVNYNFSRISK